MDENLKNKNCIPNLKICLLSHKSPRAAAKRDPALNHRFSAAASLGPSLIPSSFRWWPPGRGAKKPPFLPSVGRRGGGVKKPPFLFPSGGRRGRGAKKPVFLLPSGGRQGRGAKMFYGAMVWDPWLIVSQIVCLQCLYYLSLGVAMALLVGTRVPRLTLLYLFDFSTLTPRTPTGWCAIASFLLAAVTGYATAP